MAEQQPEPWSIFEPADDEIEEQALVEAEAAVAAGRVVSHEAVRRWLESWGTANPLPRPKCGE